MGCAPTTHGFSIMTSRQSGLPIGGEGNSQTTHGSIVVELWLCAAIQQAVERSITTYAILNSSPPEQNDPHFADDIFKCVFVNTNVRISIKISLKSVPSLSNWQYHSNGLDNGLAPNRRQTIIWTNADPIHWRTYAALRGDELDYNAFMCSRWFLSCRVSLHHISLK